MLRDFFIFLFIFRLLLLIIKIARLDSYFCPISALSALAITLHSLKFIFEKKFSQFCAGASSSSSSSSSSLAQHLQPHPVGQVTSGSVPSRNHARRWLKWPPWRHFSQAEARPRTGRWQTQQSMAREPHLYKSNPCYEYTTSITLS